MNAPNPWPGLPEVRDRIRDTTHALLCADEPQDVAGRAHYMLAVHALQQAGEYLALACVPPAPAQGVPTVRR